MGRKVAKPDVRIAEIAAKQHGVVTLGQLSLPWAERKGDSQAH